MKKSFLFIGFFLFICCTSHLIAGAIDLDQDAPVILKTASWLLLFLSKSIQSQAVLYTTWFCTIMIAVQGICRGFAEILGLFVLKTKTQTDDKILIWVSRTAEICGRIIGWFGVGFPKMLK